VFPNDATDDLIRFPFVIPGWSDEHGMGDSGFIHCFKPFLSASFPVRAFPFFNPMYNESLYTAR
jgi:hypothetical protein